MARYRIIFAPRAERHLAQLQAYLQERAGLRRATALVQEIVAFCERFDQFPERGTRRNDLRPGMRTIGFRRRATVVFSVREDAVIIHGVYYGGRDLQRDFPTQGP